MEQKGLIIAGTAVAALVVGALVGYSLGFSSGFTSGEARGRSGLLAEQKVAEDAEKEAVKREVAEKANPFAEAEEANPLESGYKNPFDGAAAVNPFRQ